MTLDVVWLATVVAAAVSDLWRGRIAVPVTLLGALLSLVVRFATDGLGDFEHGLLSGLTGAASLGALFAGFAALRRLGWDDVSLLAAVGANRGVPQCFDVAMRIALVGALGAVVFALFRGRVSDTVRAVFRKSDGVTMPYSLAVAIGSAWAWWVAG